MASQGVVSNGGEWQTAGKAKSTKPKPKQQTYPVENNLVNGHASGNSVQQNHLGYQNGAVQNGSGNKRGGRQSSAGSYGGRANDHYSNGQLSRATSSKDDAMSKRKLLEKEAKNITKRDTVIEDVGKVFDAELAASKERLRQTFEEMHNRLNDRERMMLEELDRCKADGYQLLRQQEQRAKELKEGAAHASTMNDRQVDDLRSQIRRFMADHRFEDELSKTTRFRVESDRLLELLKSFCEVVPVGNGTVADYQKHSSMSSLVSSADGDGIHSGIGKAVSEISVGGIMMKSDSMDADQLVELTRSIRENLKLQGIAEDILPEVCGAAIAMPPSRRRPPPQQQTHQGGRGGGARNGGVQRR